MKMVKLSVLRSGRLFLQEISMVFIFVGDLVDPRSIVRPESLSQRRIPVTPLGIEAAIFLLVAQCPNQLLHLVSLLLSKDTNIAM